MRKFLLLILLPFSLFANPDLACRHIKAHLLLENVAEAVSEAHLALHQYPGESRIYALALKSLAASGQEEEMLALWETFYALFPEKAMEQEVLEPMCWGILKKGQQAPGATTQLISVIGSALTQDMYAVAFLLNGLKHTSAHIRSVSVQLSALYGDQPLREQLVWMFQNEPVLSVRLGVIEAISTLRIESLLPKLMIKVSHPKIGAKERRATIQAIVNLRETVPHEELEFLAKSKRAPLRELACEVIAHCELSCEIPLLHQLVQDTHPDVQVAALKGLGLLRAEPSMYVKYLAKHARRPSCGITAAWVWILAEPDKGDEAFSPWINHVDEEVRATAAAALAAAGSYGVDLAYHYLNNARDLYTQANLALALVGQREASKEVCTILDHFLHTNQEKWMFVEQGLFRPLLKSTLTHNPAIPNFPEVVNQTVRLELLNILAILEYPRAQEAIKMFLKQSRWGVTGLAAQTLLGEGDETAIEHVRALLEDSDPQIRIEAALVLAMWGKDSSALPHLLSAYHQADRSNQIKILEALGRIGDRKALPFLIERFQEPSLMLRMIAASILIQTLNS